MASTNREDDLLKACAKVGRFLHDFALVEQEFNDGIVQILDLKGAAADVIANSLDFLRKHNLLRTVALETSAIPSFFIRPRKSEPRLCFGRCIR